MLMFLISWLVVCSSSVDPHGLSFKSAPDGHEHVVLDRAVLQDAVGLFDFSTWKVADLRDIQMAVQVREQTAVASLSEDDWLLPSL